MSGIQLAELVIVAGIFLPALLVAGIFVLLRRTADPGGRRRGLGFLRKSGIALLATLACLALLTAWGVSFGLISGRLRRHHRYRHIRGGGGRYAYAPDGPTRAPATPQTVRQMQLAGGVSLQCTNGWVPVWGRQKCVQTFTAPGGPIAGVNFRAARTLQSPWDGLTVEIRDAGSGRRLGSWKLTEYTFGKDAVTRFFRPYTARFGPVRTVKGATYRIVFSSPNSERTGPWLINCFYRDTYPQGDLFARTAAGGGKLDLAFQIIAPGGDPLLSSIPEGTDMGRREHHGPGYVEALAMLRSAPRPPRPGERPPDSLDPSVLPPPPSALPLPTPRPAMSREAALARAGRGGRIVLRRPDAVDARLFWIGVERKFLALYDARDGSLTEYSDFLRLVGGGEVTVKDMAFSERRAWAATDRGAFVYDRRTRAWSQLAVNLDPKLLNAHVQRVDLREGGAFFSLKDGKTYRLDLCSSGWTEVEK